MNKRGRKCKESQSAYRLDALTTTCAAKIHVRGGLGHVLAEGGRVLVPRPVGEGDARVVAPERAQLVLKVPDVPAVPREEAICVYVHGWVVACACAWPVSLLMCGRLAHVSTR